MNDTLALLRRRPWFRALWASDAVSLLGDWFSLVAVSTLSYAAPGGGVMALAATLGAHLLPQSLAAPIAGAIADRYDRRRVLIAGSLAEGALTLAMLAAAHTGTVPALQLALALRSAVSAAREPATGAALPSLVAREELRSANTFTAVSWSVVFALGMALGGVVTSLSPIAALAVDAVTFFVAAALLRTLPALPPIARRERGAGWERAATSAAAQPARRAPGITADLRVALRAALRPGARRAVFAGAATAFTAGAGWLALNQTGSALPLALGAATSVGALQAVRGASTAIGPLFAQRFRGAALERVADIAALAVAAGTAIVALATRFELATLGVFVWGAGGGALWMILTTEIQEQAAPEMRGRFIAFFGQSFAVAMSGGAFGAAWLLGRGLPSWSVALLAAVATLVAWAAIRHLGVGSERLTESSPAEAPGADSDLEASCSTPR